MRNLMLTANQLLDLLTDVLAENGLSKSHIRSYYNNLASKMSSTDARLFASVKYLKALIDDKEPKPRANNKSRLKKLSREDENDENP